MLNDSAVPHLTTALKGPLHKLEKHLLVHQLAIEAWLREQWHITPPVFYSSVDLRNAGFKLAPVDTNLFPAGFNNLNADFIPLCIQAVQATMEQICPNVAKILLIPENHTRNMFYFEHLATLQNIFTQAGFISQIGSMMPDLKEPLTVTTPSGKTLTISPLERKGNRVGVGDFSPCLIVLNNDLAEGIPDILKNLEQKIMPPLNLGWATRLKSVHFRHYEQVCQEFAQQFDLDPWLISPYFRNCGEVNFMTGDGDTCLVQQATELFTDIKKKYHEYGVEHNPFLVVKADAGTYGMAVMMIQDPAELMNLNRKKRTSMSTIKGGKSVSKVIIQEGVHSFETWDDAVAEPVVYMIGRHVVGGFYRVHANKGVDENLNAPGMNFQPLAFAKHCNAPKHDDPEACNNRFYAYGVIARLALLAAARELAEQK